MDKFDQSILQLLAQNARTTVSELATQVHLSRSAVSERIKKLEQQGIIRGYQLVLGPLGRADAETPQPAAISAYLEIQHTAASCQQLVPVLLQIPEILSCRGISGEVDLMLYLEAGSMARLHQIREQIDAMPEVQRVRTHMVLSEWFNRPHQR